MYINVSTKYYVLVLMLLLSQLPVMQCVCVYMSNRQIHPYFVMIVAVVF